MTSERFWARADSSHTHDATHLENDMSMTLHHWQKLRQLGPQWQRLTGLLCWSRQNRGLVSLLTRTSGAFHRSYSGVHSTLTLFVWIECHHLKARIDSRGKAVSKGVSEFKRLYSVNYPRYKLWIVATLNPQLLNSVRIWVKFKG